MITANIVTDNVCATVSIAASLSGTLTSYTDSSDSVEEEAYVAGSTMFFQVTVTADVEIDSATVENVIVWQNDVPQTIVSNQVAVNGNQLINYVPPTFSANPSFSFDAVYAPGSQGFTIFDSDLDSGVFIFEVEAQLSVTYRTTFSKKRSSVEHKTISVKRKLVLDTTRSGRSLVDFNTNSASAVTFSAGTMATAAAVGFFALL